MSVTDSLEHAAQHGHHAASSAAAHAHAHGKNLFSKKIGPLSAGAWLGVVVGGVALGLVVKKHAGAGASSVPPASTPTDLTSAGDTTGAGTDPGGLASPGLPDGYTEPTGDTGQGQPVPVIVITTPGPTPTPTTPTPTTPATPDPTKLGGVPLPTHTPAPTTRPVVVPTTTHPRTPAPAPRPAPSTVHPLPTTATRSYTIKAGDTLSAIGARFHVPWTHVYDLNAAKLEAAAKAHGRSSSDHGHWIYPGTVLSV